MVSSAPWRTLAYPPSTQAVMSDAPDSELGVFYARNNHTM